MLSPAQKAWLMSILILLSVAGAYMINGDWPLMRTLSKITASAGTLLIALSFLLGSAWKLLQRKDNPMEYQKTFGMVGFGLVALHALIALSFGSVGAFRPENTLSVLAAAAAFVLFAILAATSSPLVIDGLGYERWRGIQRLGYWALAVTLIHIGLIGSGQYIATLIGQVAFIIVALAILAKVYFLLKR